MLNFIWLDIDSSFQTNASKWLNSSCDSTLTQLEKILDDSWLDSYLGIHTSRFSRDSPGFKALSRSVNQKVPVKHSASHHA